MNARVLGIAALALIAGLLVVTALYAYTEPGRMRPMMAAVTSCGKASKLRGASRDSFARCMSSHGFHGTFSRGLSFTSGTVTTGTTVTETVP